MQDYLVLLTFDINNRKSGDDEKFKKAMDARGFQNYAKYKDGSKIKIPTTTTLCLVKSDISRNSVSDYTYFSVEDAKARLDLDVEYAYTINEDLFLEIFPKKEV